MAGRRAARNWRQWRSLVEAFAAPSGEPDIEEPAYRALHRELLTGCRRHAAAGGERQQLFRKLESLVEPWLTTETLAGADPATLASLLRNCDQVGLSVFGAERASNGFAWAFGIILLLAGLGALYFAGQSAGVFPGTFTLNRR